MLILVVTSRRHDVKSSTDPYLKWH